METDSKEEVFLMTNDENVFIGRSQDSGLILLESFDCPDMNISNKFNIFLLALFLSFTYIYKMIFDLDISKFCPQKAHEKQCLLVKVFQAIFNQKLVS